MDVDGLTFRYDVMAKDKCGKEWEAILISRIVVLAQGGMESLASHTKQ